MTTPWLTGWKSISAYVGKSIDTCKRWEKELKMPVHRPGGGPVCIPEQLDLWLIEMTNLTSNEDCKGFVEYRNQATKPSGS